MIDVVDLSSDSDDEPLAIRTAKQPPKPAETKPPVIEPQQRTARKSTVPAARATPIITTQTTTRRQAALASRGTMVKLLENSNKLFMENFNPDTSQRERRKITRKYTQSMQATNTRKPRDALYDENGIHIVTGIDMCDCLKTSCSGCFFPCPKCRSTKCGIDCRVNRKFTYEQLEYQGCDIVVKNPLL